MALRLDLKPRWFLDTSSIVEPNFTFHLRRIVDRASEIKAKAYQFGRDGETDYVDQWDRPFIFPSPCWVELKEAHRVLSKLDPYLAEKVQRTLVLLEDLLKEGFVTAKERDDPRYGETLNERKMAWLVRIRDTLEKKGKKILFHSENPMLLIRASIAHINFCTAEEQL